MTVAEACTHARSLRARVVEIVYCKGSARVNVVMRTGKPRTWRCER